MTARFATVLVLSMTAGTAAQADLCKGILALGSQGADIILTLPGTDETAQCTRSLVLSGGSQMHCGWAFSYRATAATNAFEHLVNTVTGCLGGAAHVTADQDVNHPDFYDLQTFQLNGREIAVSLKDKAALSQTYVFLRVAVPE